jgi:hypothetical protein
MQTTFWSENLKESNHLEEENIKMNPKEGMHWIYAVQDRD